MYKIQDIYLKPVIGDESIQEMFYRGNEILDFTFIDDGSTRIKKNSFFETFTYYGALSAEKWKKYTYANRFFLVLTVKGSFELTLFGHYIEKKAIKKEYFGKFRYDLKEKTEIVLPYPASYKSQVIAFSITAKSALNIYQSYYATDVEDGKAKVPYIYMVTTTFKKETYIRKNILSLKETLFNDEEFKNHFFWHIVDNGATLEEFEDKNIDVVHNANVGGAGGFAKGMIDSFNHKNKPSHILLMDDDVNVSPESFKRLYRLLTILRPEFSDYFISGAMLNMDVPYIQHENTGRVDKDGYCVPLKSGLDLRVWDKVLLNETIEEDIENRYAAWWFCCIPTSIVALDNLPLPIFVRCDDIEYSIRNHANFITLNGISIWHEGFAGKANPIMDFYQSKRNELIINSIREELNDVDTIGFIDEIFWQELYKFNYFGAQLLLDAVEDFLKGPEWFFGINHYEMIRSKNNEKYKTKPLPQKLKDSVDYNKLYQHPKVSKIKKFIYDYTFNGQARIPEFLLSKKQGKIPYGGGYYPENQLLVSSNLAIDTINDKYIEYTKDRVVFNKIRKDYISAKKRYFDNIVTLRNQYRDYGKKTVNEVYWKAYLEKAK